MKEILCSTGALLGKANNRNHRLLDECAKMICCDGFELMIHGAWYENIERIVPEIKEMSLNIPIIHCDKDLGEKISASEEGASDEVISEFEINCQVASELKVSKMVIHLWGGLQSDQNIQKNISAFRVLNDIAEKYGVTLMVENVVCNRNNPMSHLRALSHAYPDISFTFDTKMAAFHDQLDMIYEKEWSWLWNEKYIKHLHINDYNGTYMDWKNLKTLHVGDGKIDFERFFEFLRNLGYSEAFTIEATSFFQSGEIEFDEINKSINIIRSYVDW